MKNQSLIIILSVALSLSVGFYAGTNYQSGKDASIRNGLGSLQANFRNRQNGTLTNSQPSRNGGQLIGEITSQDDKSITIKLTDGSSKIVFLSSTTAINKESAVTKTDLTVGTKIGVFGQSNTDGSLNAQSIQINPIQRQLMVSPTPSIPTK